jgi:hypothetical protein
MTLRPSEMRFYRRISFDLAKYNMTQIAILFVPLPKRPRKLLVSRMILSEHVTFGQTIQKRYGTRACRAYSASF